MTAETAYKPLELYEEQKLFATPESLEDLMAHPLVQQQSGNIGAVTCTMMMYNVMVQEINKVITSLNSALEEIETLKSGSSH